MTNNNIIIIIIIIIRRLITRILLKYMTECEARAVTRWKVGSCLRMVCKTINRWVLSRCLKVCTVGAFLMAAGIYLIPNLGGAVAKGTTTKVSCYSWNIEQLLTG